MILLKFWQSIVWFLLILYGSLAPKQSLDDSLFLFQHQDKVIHFILYAVLILLFIYNYSNYSVVGQRIIVISFIAFSGMSLGIEFLQPIMSARTCDIFDFLANVSGLLIGIVIVRLFVLKKNIFST